MLCYKILHNLTQISNVEKIFIVEGSGRTRGHSWKLKADTPRLETRLHFFAYRTASAWNHLKDNTVSASNVFMFKKLLLKENLSKFLTLNLDKDFD